MSASAFEDQQLQTLLEKVAKQEGIKNPKFTITQGCKPGDNFIGRVYRAIVSETNNTKDPKTLSLIFKASPLNKFRQKTLSTDQVFRTETEVYEQILPTLNKLLNKYGLVNSDTFPDTPKCFAYQLNDGKDDDMADVIVLEDKSAEGYQMGDRTKSLDADHCRMILRKLALWHSASLALNELQPDIAARFKKLLSKDIWFSDKRHPLLLDLKQGAVNSLDILKEPYKKGYPAFDRFSEIIHDFENEFIQVNDPNADLACIHHGDCWTNNILFKYNKDQSLADVCLIDLQLSRVANPVVELSYLIFLCTTKDTRDQSYDELMRYYYNEVSRNLKRMECDPEKIFSWKRFEDSLRNYGRMGVLIAMTALPVFLADSSDISLDVNSENHEGSAFSGCAKITDPVKREALATRLTDVVIDADRWGYLL